MFSGCLIQLSTSHLEYKGAAILNISARIWNTTADKKKKYPATSSYTKFFLTSSSIIPLFTKNMNDQFTDFCHRKL